MRIVVAGPLVYRHADYIFGAKLHCRAAVCAFSPFDFHTYWIPFDVIALFVAGAFIVFSRRLDSAIADNHRFRAQSGTHWRGRHV